MKKLKQAPLANFWYCKGCMNDPYSFAQKENAPRFDNESDWFNHLYFKHYKTLPRAWGFANVRREQNEQDLGMCWLQSASVSGPEVRSEEAADDSDEAV